eukprot:TRINITY_DN14907_c0_g2_i3.p1 TRINITY_DN14907_c0_g2~~TRINITY_DN14907_c0_g2_i3.p1  ORF type:complete len:161 (+),score=6.60 TRINITY_DN14907_c0_g2_i3:76-558(+)
MARLAPRSQTICITATCPFLPNQSARLEVPLGLTYSDLAERLSDHWGLPRDVFFVAIQNKHGKSKPIPNDVVPIGELQSNLVLDTFAQDGVICTCCLSDSAVDHYREFSLEPGARFGLDALDDLQNEQAVYIWRKTATHQLVAGSPLVACGTCIKNLLQM